jgi:multidrug transporter EmrE-like cation transporter
MSVSFVLVIFASNLLFQEPISLFKIIGITSIVIGILMIGLGEK